MQSFTVQFVVEAPARKVWRVLHPPVPPDPPRPRVITYAKGRMEILNEGDDAGEGLVRTCVFDDPELIDRGWVVGYEQGLVGHFEQLGVLFGFSDTPARAQGPPLLVGDSSRRVLAEMGLSGDEIDELIDARAVYDRGDRPVAL